MSKLKESAENVTDFSVALNTGDGISTFTSEIIKGELKAIIIDSPIKVGISIESELGYCLLDIPEIVGVNYIPIVVRKQDKNGHGYQDGTNYYLNEKLIITLNGQANQDISIILRYE